MWSKVASSCLLLIALSGCLSGTDPVQEEHDVDPAPTEPVVQEFRGWMTASALAPLAHQDPESEMLVAGVQREGFVLEVLEVPETLQVDLLWSSMSPAAQALAMVNIPTAVDGQVLDVLSGRDSTGHACMQIPMEHVQAGLLSVMAHTMNAAAVQYTVRITTIGGDVVLHADRGHMEVERAGGDAVDPLPCPEA